MGEVQLDTAENNISEQPVERTLPTVLGLWMAVDRSSWISISISAKMLLIRYSRYSLDGRYAMYVDHKYDNKN